MTPSVLIAELSELDPYSTGLVCGEEHPGPILCLLQEKRFDALVLIYRNEQADKMDQIRAELDSLHPQVKFRAENIGERGSSGHAQTAFFLQSVVDSVRTVVPNAVISVLLDNESAQTNLAWMRIVYRNAGMKLLQVCPMLHATTARPNIELIEESLPLPVSHRALRETPKPMADDIARSLGLTGKHPSFCQLIDSASSMARFDNPVLICGEPGSGKTTLAHLIWQLSPRSGRKMQIADPADLPDPLAYALLFGSQDSGSKSAAHSVSGMIENCADNGTLLVENVENLSDRVQEAIAHYLASGEFFAQGARHHSTANARLIFTSESDSIDRANIVPSLKNILFSATLRIPPLRERREDIPIIALHYLRRINMSLKNARSISRDALRNMQKMPWHENVRELRVAIERAALFSPKPELGAESMCVEEESAPEYGRSVNPQLPEIGEGFSLESYLGDLRKRLILRALELSKGNQSEAARMLHITPQAVHQFVKFQAKLPKK